MQCILGDHVKYQLGDSGKNFPNKAFYNVELDEIYSFYRQGDSFVINAQDVTKYEYKKMIDLDIGEIFLVYD